MERSILIFAYKVWKNKGGGDRINSVYHRNHDLPSIVGFGEWYWNKKGKNHREKDLPATIFYSGNRYWYKEEKYHREKDLPAVIFDSGEKHWYKEGTYIKNE